MLVGDGVTRVFVLHLRTMFELRRPSLPEYDALPVSAF